MPPLTDFQLDQMDRNDRHCLSLPMMGVGNTYHSYKVYFWNANPYGDASAYYFYPMLVEGRAMIVNYHKLSDSEQIVAGAIFADWLEEHREYLLVGAKGPTDPAKRLDDLILYLRSRLCPTSV